MDSMRGASEDVVNLSTQDRLIITMATSTTATQLISSRPNASVSSNPIFLNAMQRPQSKDVHSSRFTGTFKERPVFYQAVVTAPIAPC